MLEAHVLAILILGLSSFIVGSIPLRLTKWSQQPFFLSFLLCWGGGVLLATSIVHMLSEVKSKFSQSELVFCGGFLLLYAVDEVLHLCVQNVHTEHNEDKVVRRESKIQSLTNNDSDEENVKMPPIIPHGHRTSYGTIDKLPKRARFYSLSHSFQDANFSQHCKKHPSSLSLHARSPEIISCCCRRHIREQNFLATCESNHDDSQKLTEDCCTDSSSLSSLNLLEQCHIEVKKAPCPKRSHSSVTGLLAALLIHSILEGCSIGVQTDSKTILMVLGAVLCHKLVLAFCLGLELATAGYEGFRFLVVLTVFSVGCPIGIVVGVSIVHTSAGVFEVEAPLQAFAAGSLLYVAVFEVLPRERYKWQHKTDNRYATFFQMVAVLLGFALIILLGFLSDGHMHATQKTGLEP